MATKNKAKPRIEPALAKDMLEKMYLIRHFEQRVVKLFQQGLIRGATHVYLGEEAIAVGACAALGPDDYITSTHRGHGHVIARGLDVKRMLAELLGKATGYCGGKGGSMHIADIKRGILEKRHTRRERRGWRIVNVTSISGEKATNPKQVPYCASKGGANMLTKVMAVALAPYKITVNAVLPGTIKTDINRDILESGGIEEAICEATPLGCLGQPEHIAEAVIYFASDEAAWTTGALLPVDGGFML